MRHTKPQSQARADRSRRERESRTAVRDQVFMTVFMTLVTLGAIFFLGPIILQKARDETALKERGLDALAEVKRTWSVPGSARTAPSYHARFAFGRGAATPMTVDEVYVTAREYRDLTIGARVPIVYDPQRPSLAELNFSGKVRRRHPLVENLFWALLLYAIVGLAWVGSVMFLRDALNERRLVTGPKRQ